MQFEICINFNTGWRDYASINIFFYDFDLSFLTFYGENRVDYCVTGGDTSRLQLMQSSVQWNMFK